jgi:phosphoinositide-3-kinase regulatory subunit 4
MKVLQKMSNPRHLGPITTLCMDKKRAWIVVGSSTGVVSLWDRRFGLLLKSWRVGVSLGGKSARIHQCVLHPTKGKGRWIIVALESKAGEEDAKTLIEVWDVETSTLKETFVTTFDTAKAKKLSEETISTTSTDAETSPSAAISSLVRMRQQDGLLSSANVSRGPLSPGADSAPALPPSPDVRALVAGVDFGGHSTAARSDLGISSTIQLRGSARGFMITGSADRKLRLLDFARSDRTGVLSGLDSESERPSYRYVPSSVDVILNC